jgi:LysR family transcriptional regulator, hypochlorite-specific transcription factor HypT
LLCYRNDAVSDPLAASGCAGIAIDHDRLMLVSVPDKNGLPLHDLRSGETRPIPFLNYSPDAFLGKVTASLINAAQPNLNLELQYESAFAEAVRAQTLAGSGVAWLPQSLILNDLKDGKLVEAGKDLPQAVLEIWMYKSGKERSSIVDSLWLKFQNQKAGT